MKRSHKITLAILGCIILTAGASIAYMLRPAKQPSKTVTNGTAGITLAEVAQRTGQNGASCWVVVDDTVYEISGFVLWADGVHSSSGGRARCGKDLSEVINESSHGKSKLRYLKEVGAFQR